MRAINQATRDMLAGNVQFAPRVELELDIDPPFVGTEFNAAGSQPNVTEHRGQWYLTLIDGDYIKVLTIDVAARRVTGIVRDVYAPAANRPRLAWEPSGIVDVDDTIHVAYEQGNQVMAYREEYDANMELRSLYDVIAVGSSIEVVRDWRVNDYTAIYHYYCRDGHVYERRQGSYEAVQPAISADQNIREIAVQRCDDGSCVFIAAMDGGVTAIISGADCMADVDCSMNVAAELTNIELIQSTFFSDGSFRVSSGISNMELVDSAQRLAVTLSPCASLAALISDVPQNRIAAGVNIGMCIASLTPNVPQQLLGESIHISASLTTLEFAP